MRVLLVEDDPLIALDVMTTLSEAGHDPLGPAATACEAYALAGEAKPAAAFVDIWLRDGVTGVDIARELRSRWHVACVFVSASEAAAMANKDAALGLILKPMDASTLVATLDLIARLKRGEASDNVPCGLTLFEQTP